MHTFEQGLAQTYMPLPVARPCIRGVRARVAVPALRVDVCGAHGAQEGPEARGGSKMTQHAMMQGDVGEGRCAAGVRRSRGEDVRRPDEARRAAMRERGAWWKMQARQARMRRAGAAIVALLLAWMWCAGLCAGW